MIDVEICCNSRASAEAAREAGATRIELCRDLECGGLTPSDEDIAYCVSKLRLRTHVLVRPRAGDFCYSAAEVEEIMATIERCHRLGAHAVVVGFLTADGRVDEGLTRRAVQAAEGMEVTFHRAFDEARQAPLDALRAIVRCGCTRLLTSGQHPTASEGAEVIKSLVEAAAHQPLSTARFHILAGSGVTPINVRQLIAATGVGEVHGSCKGTLADGSLRTDAAQVRALLASVRDL